MDGPPVPLDPEQPLEAKLTDGPCSHLATFPADTWSRTAIQCRMRGHTGLVRRILGDDLMRIDHGCLDGRGSAADEDDPSAAHFLDRSIHGRDPGQALAAAAWNHWLNAAINPDTDRREAYRQPEKLFAGEPSFIGPAREDFPESLRLAVTPGTAGAARRRL